MQSNINDPIRQASMFTSNGLIDPRFFTDEKSDARHPRRLRSVFNPWLISWLESLAVKRSIFRFKRFSA